MAALPLLSAAEAADAVSTTQNTRDRAEARHRALFALFFHESGLDPTEATVSALAATLRRLGYEITVAGPAW